MRIEVAPYCFTGAQCSGNYNSNVPQQGHTVGTQTALLPRNAVYSHTAELVQN